MERVPAGPLIDRDGLAAMLAGASPPAVLDIRYSLVGPPGVDSYLAGHLPGACYVDLETELSGPPGSDGRHPLPDPAVFEAAMRGAGLRAGQLAVAYDDGDGTVAARLWWMLRHHGHQPVAVLDGGYRAWAEAGLPVTTAVPRPEPGDYLVTSPGLMPVLSAESAARLARSGFLLDARAGERYRGEVEPVDPVPGHIPGAISAPTAANVGPTGEFLPVAELAERFAALGLPVPARATDGAAGEWLRGVVPPGQQGARGEKEPAIGVYCGSGVTAAHQVLALELVGLPAALYVGSWSAWSADPTRPVATGPQPG